VTRIILTAKASADIDRLADFLMESLPQEAGKTMDVIFDGLDVLRTHPEVGRPARGGQRELVISRGRSGYLALYRYSPEVDAVFVLAVRHQRESGYDH
jgi:plasmid stabilization system protein ParE